MLLFWVFVSWIVVSVPVSLVVGFVLRGGQDAVRPQLAPAYVRAHHARRPARGAMRVR